MKHYILGDIVDEISIRENNPSTSGYERFVGLEHYVSGEVEIVNYGSTTNLNSAMKVFQEGDILVARRNVYLKRASVVYFDGLTSGDSIVLRARDETIGRILPFILNTEDFWNYAEKHSDGTMSKRLSPKVLKNYEFDLREDSLNELADLLWSMVDTKKAYKSLLEKTDDLVKSQFIEMFGDPVDNPIGWDTVPLLELGKCKNGMNFRSKDSGYKIHCLGVADFKDNDVLNDSNELPMISLNEAPSKEYLLADGDIVFVRSNGNKALVGRTVMVFPGETPTTYSGFCIRFRKNDSRIETGYLLRVLKMNSVRQKMAGRGANIQNLNQKILSQLNILLPPIDLQEKYLEVVQQSDKSKFEIQKTINSITDLIKSVLYNAIHE